MTGLLYYAYSRGLTANELRKIDDLVCRNRKGLIIFGILTFNLFKSTAANANDDFLPGVSGLTPQTPIVRPTRPESLGSKTATGVGGSPKPGSGSGSSSSEYCPAISKERTAPKLMDRNYVPKKKEKQCSVGEMSKGPTSEMVISSEHQDQKIIITNKDVKKFMTPEDRKRFDDQKFNEKIYKNEVGIMIKYPDKIYKKFYEGKPCTIYEKNGEAESRVAIVENKSGRLKLSSSITSEEYQNLTNGKSVEFELTDLRRDPQTGVRNEKSIKEANTMERAKEQGLVENYRRPKVYLGETDVDFVSFDGSKQYELKTVTQNQYKSCQDSAKDIIRNIKNKAQNAETLPNYYIDLKGVPDCLKENIAQNIQDQLQSINNLNGLKFVY
nr:hypothetical protein [Haslea sp.]